ncbi:type 1 glutamine amidotransferase domain-containing protein [Sulfurovum sp.]|uniref:type 1 glutamine amidotransferase domain-containing protein n=1 Tax=Sulfurovum sp. TaxID=1969726 RepID=UPI002600E706|nr:type 1 glutamine amidotransferase domain-containing protein [Sulfurovum sp.]
MNTVIAILIIVTGSSSMKSGDKTGVWLEEFAVPYLKFRQEGFKVTVATIHGGNVPIDPSSLENAKPEWKDAMEALKNAQKLSTVDTSKYQAVYMPGGHGAMFDLADNEIVKQTLAKFADANKTVSAVCHGPASLVDVKLKNGKYLVEGKQVTSFTNNEEDEVNMSVKMPFMLESKLKEQGALFHAKGNWADNVVVDGKLITGQNPSASASIADAIIKSVKE